MRMGSFIIGGLIGASAVMYFNNASNRKMVLQGWNSASQNMNKWFDSAMNTVAERTLRDSKSFSNKKTSMDKGNGLEQVEKLVNEDPELKSQVDEILAEGKH